MKDLEQKLESTLEKHKKDYASICEPITGLISRQNNANKFNSANEKYTDEIIEILNIYVENKNDSERESAIEMSKDYIKLFSKLLINPFS
ncbi:hypothetical protein NLG42_17475 [Flavobacterium plurextorum]|uniref:hypothetical protein n=1 Tax=Flavobacterium TaxID=237 RepID=UPI00214D6F85|nr:MULTISPECIES: hypothetical protein [Flavobacterium]UUW07885.1 hypothetical protein NLG42_17475 [Flavobacterium plurextorum]